MRPVLPAAEATDARHIGPESGLGQACVINCDNLITIPISSLDPEPVGELDVTARAQLDRALRYSLDIVY